MQLIFIPKIRMYSIIKKTIKGRNYFKALKRKVKKFKNETNSGPKVLSKNGNYSIIFNWKKFIFITNKFI